MMRDKENNLITDKERMIKTYQKHIEHPLKMITYVLTPDGIARPRNYFWPSGKQYLLLKVEEHLDLTK